MTKLSPMRSPIVLAGCEQGTDLASDPVPVEVTAPEMDPDMAATASAEAEAARQQRATRTVGLAGTFVAPDLPALEIGEISALFDAQPADDGLLVRASATVNVTSRDDGGGDEDELTTALARPDGWALLTPLQVETPAATHVYEDAQCALVDSALAAPSEAETPDDAIGSATILSTVELPDCA